MNFHDSGEPIEALQTKIDFVQSSWVQCDEIQSKIEDLDETDTERIEIEDRLCLVLGRGKAIINLIKRAEENRINTQNNNGRNNGNHVFQRLNVELPTMNLPVFEGNSEQWLEFRDSFQGLINSNQDLSDIQRMYYLKSSLKGRAAEVIQSLEGTAENYAIAWNLLTKRFEDKRAIVSRHLQLLIDIPIMQKESGSQLRHTLDSVLRHIRALEFLEANKWDVLINHLLIAKFDSNTKREWRIHIKDIEEVTVANLTEFLEDRCLIIEPEVVKPVIGKQQLNNRSENKFVPHQKKVESSNVFASTEGDNQTIRKCAYCEENSHSLYSCGKFKDLTVSQRVHVVNERKLCRNCLRANHFAQNCQSSNCKKCNEKHNTLLHPSNKFQNDKNPSITPVFTNVNNEDIRDNNPSISSVNCSSVNFPVQSRVLLSTARVWIYDSSGVAHDCRVLLDSASQSNFLTKEFCERLQLTTHEYKCSVGGLASSINLTESAYALIRSKHTAYQTKVKLLITNRIIDKLPFTEINVEQLHIPKNLKFADVTFNVPGKIDMLLGASLFWGLLCIGQIKLGRTQPILQKTHLGWIVTGDIASNNDQSTSICCFSAEDQLSHQIEKFWKIEEIDQKIIVSKNDEFCENHFVQTHIQDDTGRFTVSLPFKGHFSELSESHDNALKRFNKLEKQFEKNRDLREDYVKFMSEYEELNHMTAVDSNENKDDMMYYIPHHPVLTTAGDRRKLRVVFDASAKTSSGKSLNDILRVGPTIQQTLFSIVLRFRQHQYVITADIVKMYRQINVREDQRNLQRILWRSSSDKPIQVYQLNTVTYGLASAPFLAIRALHQVACNIRESHPEVSRIISQDFYVDDVLTGHDDLAKLQTLKAQMITVLGASGFELAKWKSNEPSLFDQNTEEFTRSVIIGDEVKTLGLSWGSISDIFQYKVDLKCSSTCITKRVVLSTVSQIFDPLGLVGPATIKAKILIQKLWQLHVDWDESLPVDLHTEWLNYVEELKSINIISVPRLILCQDPVSIQLHGFSDASECAYGACVYLRSVNTNGEVTVRLVCAKSKVAPLKTICIPRLELCGALLLSKLVDSVIKSLSIQLSKCYYWCDSTIVLAWIYGEPHIRKTFVANRLTEIQQLTSSDQWHHVRTECNPADVISRGISPIQLMNSRLWWCGPDWLQDPEEYINAIIPVPNGETPETKAYAVLSTQVNQINDILERFSSLSRLKRVIAYCLRFRHYRKSTNVLRKQPLTVEELDCLMKTILRMIQAEKFAQELNDIRTKQRVNHASQLITLHPFIDDDGIIRVGGRLRNATISYSRKYPAVLPSNHHVTTLIIRDSHYRSLHVGAQTLLCILQESFWILSAKSSIRRVLHKCIVCFRSRPISTQLFMGDLPESRVSCSRAFLNVGVDYGGPFTIKFSRNKTCKAYVSLFICMSTKAIHLELVSDLSTASFLNALKRFIARRGKCVNLYSDNGSNFKGANNELNAVYDFVKRENHQETIDRFCSENMIQWHFIPPYSPHMGGLWEAGIKSVKTHLRRVLSEALLTFEEMYTVLCQTEAILNSRPLTPISNDPTDFTALTPGHFLIGEALTSIPDKDWLNVSINRLTRFQYISKLTQHFWTRWSTEYLSNLQQRFKWNREDRVLNIQNGTMVVLREENVPSMQWPLGRIVKCHEGKDGKIRVISIQTAKGIVKRTLAKVCILPIDV